MPVPEYADRVAPPRSMRTGWFVTTIVVLSIGIVATIVPGLSLIFIVWGLVHFTLLRRSAVRAHAAWSREQAENAIKDEQLRHLGIMDHHQRREELRRLDAAVDQAKSDFDRERAELQQSIDRHDDERVAASKKVQAVKRDISRLKGEVLDLKNTKDVQDYGLYDFENPADDSVRLGDRLRRVQAEIKDRVREGSAATGSKTMTMDGNLRKGQKVVKDMVKLLLRSYNAEAENAVKTVRAGHLTAAKKRLEKSAQAVERLGKSMDIVVTYRYRQLRESELELTHQHLEALKAAKEEEREIRRREREEAKAQREFLAAKAKQEKEVEHYRNVVASLRASGDEVEAAKMSVVLTEAEEKLEDVERTMANTRAGYVYVASNRGAFGDGVVKIGMTRRLNPDERLKELSDASVPFNFDKHTMIFAEDAVGLENALHKQFSDKRVNLINMRREYFYATPGEVKKALLDHDVQVLEYHEESEAVEFEASELQRQTRSAKRGELN